MNQGISTSKKQSFQAKAATELKEVGSLLTLSICALRNNENTTEAFDVIALVQSRLDDLQALAEDEAEEATV